MGKFYFSKFVGQYYNGNPGNRR